jgi:hypothetical protein
MIRTVTGAWLVAASIAVPQEIPAEVSALLAKSGVGGKVTAWCRAEFRGGQRGAYAVALASRSGGGRYLALEPDGRRTELGTFTGDADLSCYSRAEAETLDGTIRQSETIRGRVVPRWNTTVVCGFLDETSAECWQYAPASRTFVKVGQWVT